MEIKGIEVSGEIYDIEDETARTNASEASSNASEAKTATQTLASTVSTLSDTVSNHSTDIEQLGDEIGDLADLETTAKTDLVSAINEVDAKVDDTNKTTIFDFLTLIFGNYNATTVLQGEDDTSPFYGNIPNYANYKGIAIVCGDSQFTTNVEPGRTQGRELKFLLKRPNNSCEIQLMQYIGGDRGVTVYQNIRVTASGQLTIFPGYAAKTDSDSDSTTSQYLFGVYAVYGIN